MAKAKTEKHPGGRPEVFTIEILNKLEAAFALGATDREACSYAGISMATLYNKQNRDPKFLERKNLLKEKPCFKARAVIIDAINKGDVGASKWYLEKKRRTEFGEEIKVNETSFNINARVDNIPKIRKLRKELMGEDD